MDATTLHNNMAKTYTLLEVEKSTLDSIQQLSCYLEEHISEKHYFGMATEKLLIRRIIAKLAHNLLLLDQYDGFSWKNEFNEITQLTIKKNNTLTTQTL